MKGLLIVGLGNPGKQYCQTRHNAGFEVVRAFAQEHGFAFKGVSSLMGEFAIGQIGEQKLFLLLPTTFMNESGYAVRKCIDYYQVPIDHLLVISDDVALDVGQMRIRMKGSAGGHNGLKSIQAHLGTSYYMRLRIGVGAPPVGVNLTDYVLGRFLEKELQVMEEVVKRAVAILTLYVKTGIALAMQEANRKFENEEK